MNPEIECPSCGETCDTGSGKFLWAGCDDCGLYGSAYHWESVRERIQRRAEFLSLS